MSPLRLKPLNFDLRTSRDNPTAYKLRAFDTNVADLSHVYHIVGYRIGYIFRRGVVLSFPVESP
jgi:hypothetical protein